MRIGIAFDTDHRHKHARHTTGPRDGIELARPVPKANPIRGVRLWAGHKFKTNGPLERREPPGAAHEQFGYTVTIAIDNCLNVAV